MRVLAVLAAPADYTLDLIRNVYRARGVDWVFLKRTSPGHRQQYATPRPPQRPERPG